MVNEPSVFEPLKFYCMYVFIENDQGILKLSSQPGISWSSNAKRVDHQYFISRVDNGQ